ncbi:ATP-binding protein [Aminomonas paucivorans]|uniref:ATP-binding protein n=1 Tax=Aminomonas paucivorans TaxID=81412 RepID=UPI0033213D1C
MPVRCPSGIPMHGTLSVHLPPEPAFLPLLLATLRELSSRLGFSQEDGCKLELALEEAFSALAVPLGESTGDEAVEVRFRRVPLGLRISLAGHRRPLSRQDLTAYTPDKASERDGEAGLGLYMLLHLMDQVTLTEGTANRQELHFFKRLPEGAGTPPEAGTCPPPPEEGEDRAPASADRVLPTQKDALVQEGGFPSLPWAELLTDPSQALFAARNAGGRNLALQGWGRHDARSTLGLMGPCHILPGVPEEPCRRRLLRAVTEQAIREGQGGLLATYPLGEARSLPPEGFAPCALLPYTPATPFSPETEGPCALLFHPLGPSGVLGPLGVPPTARGLLAGLYARWGENLAPPQEGGREGLAPRSILSVTSQTPKGRTNLRVHAYGADFPLRLRELTAHLLERGYRHLLLHLPLELPATAFEAEAARQQGYVLVGVLPGTPGGDELLCLHRSGLPLPQEAAGAAEALCPSLAAHLKGEGGALG